MTVVAEGLEDLGMTEAATVLGAEHGQGCHLARPMPAAEVSGWAAEFESRDGADRIRPAVGALAFHWKFQRLGSPRPHTVQECPLTGYLEFRGATSTVGMPSSTGGEQFRCQPHDCRPADPGDPHRSLDLLKYLTGSGDGGRLAGTARVRPSVFRGPERQLCHGLLPDAG
jgi:hypothetical protein